MDGSFPRIGVAGALFLLPVAAPAGAQGYDPVRVQALTPECARARGGDEILVCGRRDEPRSRYRLPVEPDQGFDPGAGVASVSRERSALMGAPRGGAGIGSCSTVGPGGYTGCMANDFHRDIEQYGGDLPNMRNGYRGRRR